MCIRDRSFEIVDLLSEINRRGTTVLMVTHEHSLVTVSYTHLDVYKRQV